MQTTIIFPCYNESSRLSVSQFTVFLDANPEIQFLFVNDGSKDHTLELLQSMSCRNERIFYLDLPQNGGKAEAVRQGMLYATDHFASDYIGFWDADLATPLGEINLFLNQIQNGDFEMITGLRLDRLGANIKRKKIRHYLGRCFATVASMTLKLSVYDTQCGAKLYKSNIVTPLFEQPFITRWLFDVELLARYINLYGRKTAVQKIYEYPLYSWEDVGGSQVKMKDFFKAPRELWMIKKKYMKKTK